jgi:hypothetical protein
VILKSDDEIPSFSLGSGKLEGMGIRPNSYRFTDSEEMGSLQSGMAVDQIYRFRVQVYIPCIV